MLWPSGLRLPCHCHISSRAGLAADKARVACETPRLTLARCFALAYRQLMRLKSNIWVAAYLRRCQADGGFGAVRRRGAEEAGAVFVKVSLLDGTAMLFVPAPQTVYEDGRPIDRFFVPAAPQPLPEGTVEERLVKEIRFDPDAWI